MSSTGDACTSAARWPAPLRAERSREIVAEGHSRPRQPIASGGTDYGWPSFITTPVVDTLTEIGSASPPARPSGVDAHGRW